MRQYVGRDGEGDGGSQIGKWKNRDSESLVSTSELDAAVRDRDSDHRSSISRFGSRLPFAIAPTYCLIGHRRRAKRRKLGLCPAAATTVRAHAQPLRGVRADVKTRKRVTAKIENPLPQRRHALHALTRLPGSPDAARARPRWKLALPITSGRLRNWSR